MARAFEFCESILGLLAAFVLGIAIPAAGVFGGIGLVFEGSVVSGIGLMAAGLLAGWSSVVVIQLASRWERDVFRMFFEPRPDAPETFTLEEGNEVTERDRRTLIGFMASSLPSLPWMFRLWCALYWILLVGAATWLGHHLCRGAAHAMNNNWAVLFTLACVGHLAFLVAANLYLVLSVAVLFPRTHDWLTFYRARLFLDALAIAVSLALVFTIP